MGYIKITNGSITMSVPEADIDNYIRAGYQVVKEEPVKKAKMPKAEEPDGKYAE